MPEILNVFVTSFFSGFGLINWKVITERLSLCCGGRDALRHVMVQILCYGVVEVLRCGVSVVLCCGGCVISMTLIKQLNMKAKTIQYSYILNSCISQAY